MDAKGAFCIILLSPLLLLVAIVQFSVGGDGGCEDPLCEQWEEESTTSCFVKPGCIVTFEPVAFNVTDLGYIWVTVEFNKTIDGTNPEQIVRPVTARRFWFNEKYRFEADGYSVNIFDVDRDRFSSLGLVSASLSFKLDRTTTLQDGGVYDVTMREGVVFNEDAVILRHTYYLYTRYVLPNPPVCTTEASTDGVLGKFLLTCAMTGDFKFPSTDRKVELISISENCTDEEDFEGRTADRNRVRAFFSPCENTTRVFCIISHLLKRTEIQNWTSSCEFDLTSPWSHFAEEESTLDHTPRLTLTPKLIMVLSIIASILCAIITFGLIFLVYRRRRRRLRSKRKLYEAVYRQSDGITTEGPITSAYYKRPVKRSTGNLVNDDVPLESDGCNQEMNADTVSVSSYDFVEQFSEEYSSQFYLQVTETSSIYEGCN